MWNLKKAELLETKQNGGYQEPGNGGVGEKSLKHTNPQLEGVNSGNLMNRRVIIANNTVVYASKLLKD